MTSKKRFDAAPPQPRLEHPPATKPILLDLAVRAALGHETRTVVRVYEDGEIECDAALSKPEAAAIGANSFKMPDMTIDGKPITTKLVVLAFSEIARQRQRAEALESRIADLERMLGRLADSGGIG